MSTLNCNVTSGKNFVVDAQGKTLVTPDDLNRLGVPTVTVEISDEVATADIKDGAVTAIKLASNAVETAKIKDAAVETVKIKDANVTAGKLAADAVETAKIKDANVTAAKLATDAVETAKIKNSNVTAAKLEDALADALVTSAAATVGTEATDTVTVTVQVKDAQGNSLLAVVPVTWWLTDTDVVGPVGSGAFSSTTTYSNGVRIKAVTADYHEFAATDAAGILKLVFTFTGGARTKYFRIALGSRIVNGSQAMTWA